MLRTRVEPPLERIVVRTALVAAGKWRCARAHPRFADTGPIEHYLVAFPRTAVRIRHAGGRPFVADATRFTMYNRGQRYTRAAVDEAGDRCDWWAVTAPLAQAIARDVDPRAPHDTERPFCFEGGPASAALYLRQRLLLRALDAGAVDRFAAEEEIIALVALALRAAVGERSDASARAAHRELAEATRVYLGVRYRDALSLGSVAAALGVSAYHLCRVFRQVTGVPMHRHLLALRLRAVLPQVAAPGRDLAGVALDAGFASHSHFSAAFARHFGMTPSAWRAVHRQRVGARAVAGRRV
jgi:AraC-like DNA-binding protein